MSVELISPVMDVIVVGLGASGLAAIRRLHDAGLKVLGLEAAERLGGRIHSVQFGACLTDIGAAWCHGEKDNKVFELANPHNLLGRPVVPEKKWFILSNGELVPSDTGESILQILDSEVKNADKQNAKSISECVRSALQNNETLQKDLNLSKSFVEWFERNSHVGGKSDPLKSKSLKGLVENWVCEGEQMLNWKGRGYQTILDILLNKYPDPSNQIAVELLLKKEVDNIKWSTSHIASDSNPLVQVKCSDGSLFAAKSLLITVPVGVLKERHENLFSPPLPAEKITAINNIEMCTLDKIYIEFESPWWTHPSNFLIIWREEDKAAFAGDLAWITNIYGLWTIEYQPHVILAWIYDEGAKEMEKVSEETVRAGIQKLLNVVFKSFNLTPIKDLIRTKWSKNRFARGSYSYRSVATELLGGSAKILSEPLCRGTNNFPLVCFGGEATSQRRHNSVHGAIEAGFREADRLIESFRISES